MFYESKNYKEWKYSFDKVFELGEEFLAEAEKSPMSNITQQILKVDTLSKEEKIQTLAGTLMVHNYIVFH